MIDKTVLELVDRLVATSNRAALAESALETTKATLEENLKTLNNAQNTILGLQQTLVEMKEQMEKEKESTNRTINYWANKATKLEDELKALKEAKNDSDGTGST